MLYAFSEGVAERGLSMPAFVDLTSANAARFYGMWPRKGCIAPGSDADLVLIDPADTTVLGMGESASAIDYSIYEGMEMSGRIARVFKGGRQVYDGERVCAEPVPVASSPADRALGTRPKSAENREKGTVPNCRFP